MSSENNQPPMLSPQISVSADISPVVMQQPLTAGSGIQTSVALPFPTLSSPVISHAGGINVGYGRPSYPPSSLGMVSQLPSQIGGGTVGSAVVSGSISSTSVTTSQNRSSYLNTFYPAMSAGQTGASVASTPSAISIGTPQLSYRSTGGSLRFVPQQTGLGTPVSQFIPNVTNTPGFGTVASNAVSGTEMVSSTVATGVGQQSCLNTKS